MLAWIRKVIRLSITDRVPSGEGEFKPMEIPPAIFEDGSSCESWEMRAPFLHIPSYFILMKSVIFVELSN